MKKYMYIFALVLASTLGCTRRHVCVGKEKKRVLVTVPMIHDLVKMVAKDRLSCDILIGPGIDPHSYEVVSGDRKKIQRADLVIANGLMLEHGANLQKFIKEHKNSIFLGDFFMLHHKDRLIFIEGQVDPHIWMDISLWQEALTPIIKKLQELDPEHSQEYEKNGAMAKKELEDLDRALCKKMQAIDKKHRYIITTHDAFYYFARQYLADPGEKDWKSRVMAPQGLNPQEEISLFQLENICCHIIKHDLHHLFFESNLSKQSLKRIIEVCKDRGQKIKLCEDPLYGDTVDPKGGPIENYTAMMKHNAALIASVLNQEGA